MLAILSFLYGASLGSFVQVLVTRLHVANVLNARSKCLSCGTAIKWYDLVPVVSYLVLRGKCRECKSSFGVASLITEMLFGAVFLCVYYTVLLGRGVHVSSVLWLIYYTLFVVILGVITLYDLKHKMIPNIFFVMFLLLSFFTMIGRYVVEHNPYIFLAPFVVALPFTVAYLVTKGKALGFGDILMYLAVGGFLGMEQGVAVLILSVWIGGIVGVFLHLKNRKMYSMKTALPFVPFITLAFLIVLFTEIDIISIGHMFTWWYY